MQAVGQHILVRPFEGDEISDGGIYVPVSVRKPSNKGIVVSVGKGGKKPMEFKEGQIVFRVKDWGEPVIISGQLHYLMNQDAVLASE